MSNLRANTSPSGFLLREVCLDMDALGPDWMEKTLAFIHRYSSIRAEKSCNFVHDGLSFFIRDQEFRIFCLPRTPLDFNGFLLCRIDGNKRTDLLRFGLLWLDQEGDEFSIDFQNAASARIPGIANVERFVTTKKEIAESWLI